MVTKLTNESWRTETRFALAPSRRVFKERDADFALRFLTGAAQRHDAALSDHPNARRLVGRPRTISSFDDIKVSGLHLESRPGRATTTFSVISGAPTGPFSTDERSPKSRSVPVIKSPSAKASSSTPTCGKAHRSLDARLPMTKKKRSAPPRPCRSQASGKGGLLSVLGLVAVLGGDWCRGLVLVAVTR